jgi:hypothetical protein
LKRLFVPLIICFSAVKFFACSPAKLDSQKARILLENALFSPEQAYGKHKTFYIRTERVIDEASSASKYINELNEESYGLNALFENKVIQELYVQDNKLRLSAYVESLSAPLELHLIYDGEKLWSVSNFAMTDSQEMTFAQAKDFISFPASDFFRRLRSGYEQSGKEIQYKHTGTAKQNGYKCYVIEMSLKGDESSKAVFFIDKKTNVVVKAEWPGIFPNVLEVKKIGKMSGKKVPAISEIFYGEYFTAMLKYSVKTDEYIHPDVFNEANILLPMRSMYKDVRFQEEKPEQRRARIRVVLDSVQSFEFVLSNMHLTDMKKEEAETVPVLGGEIEIPELSKKLIPDNTAAFRIPMASNEQPAEPKKKAIKPKKKPQPKKTAPSVKKEKEPAFDDENDETDLLEYSPKDAYKSIEAELEAMKESDPEGYIKMKRIVEEMKAKEENIKQMQGS